MTWVVLTSGTSRSSGQSERDDSDMVCAYIRHVKVFWCVCVGIAVLTLVSHTHTLNQVLVMVTDIDVLNLKHPTQLPPLNSTASTQLNCLHSTQLPPLNSTASTQLNCLHSTNSTVHQLNSQLTPLNSTASTQLNCLHSTVNQLNSPPTPQSTNSGPLLCY